MWILGRFMLIYKHWELWSVDGRNDNRTDRETYQSYVCFPNFMKRVIEKYKTGKKAIFCCLQIIFVMNVKSYMLMYEKARILFTLFSLGNMLLSNYNMHTNFIAFGTI